MSAVVLREAASLMRLRAEAATDGPWESYGDHLVWPSRTGPAANDPILAMVGAAHQDSSEHIASWHPAVALAVADSLDQAAELIGAADSGPLAMAMRAIAEPLIAVARAYLGT